MTIHLKLDLEKLNKGRKFVYLEANGKRTELYTQSQAQTIVDGFRALGIEVKQENQLIF